MKKYLPIAVACTSLFFLAQFSQDSSVAGREKPRIDVYGIVIDKDGKEFTAENITISGAYKQIIMYIKPIRSDVSPTKHQTFIDLSEEKEISVSYDGDKPKLYKFNNREYIELKIVDVNQITNSYIIERTRNVYFDEPYQAGPKEHRVALEVLDKIVIDGYKEHQKQKKSKKITRNYARKSYKVI